MVHVKSPLLNFKLDLEHENVDILKNGFYHRILHPSEYPKRERAKKNFFSETLLDGPLYIYYNKYLFIIIYFINNNKYI